MATAITPLANITLSSAVSVITFSSIASGFKDLMLVITPLAPTTGGGVCFRFNNDSATNYNSVVIAGTGSAAATGGANSNALGYFASDSSSQSTVIANIFDYSSSDKYKAWISRSNQIDGQVRLWSGNWKSTAAITSVQVRNDSQNFSIGATFALYGVSA